MSLVFSWALFISLLAAIPAAAHREAPRAVFRDTHFVFGRTLHGSVVEHDFWLKNAGSATLRIESAVMTPPLVVTRMPRELASGGEGLIHFKLDTANLAGPFKGEIRVFLNDPETPEADLDFAGVVIPPVEVSPLPAFFVSGLRGQRASASEEIVNHEAEPLHILKIEHPRERFTTALETVQPGQRYKLTLILNPDAPPGRNSDLITVTTSSKAQPVLKIAANTFVHERVYAFPDSVDLGTISIPQLQKNPAILRLLSQTLMIYQEQGSDFRVQLSTDLPGLNLKSERGPRGDRYQVQIALTPENVRIGSMKGSIVITTNDPKFPRLVVPVSGQIVDR